MNPGEFDTMPTEVQSENEGNYMYTNITEIMEVEMSDVNDRLKLGWVILHFSNQADAGYPFDGDQRAWTMCVMGLTRQYPCGAASFGHTEPKQYDHDTGKWYCVSCKEGELKRKADREYDDIPF